MIENIENFFNSTLNDKYWECIKTGFTKYYIDQTKDNNLAVDYIFKEMVNNYSEEDLLFFEQKLKRLIDVYLITILK